MRRTRGASAARHEEHRRLTGETISLLEAIADDREDADLDFDHPKLEGPLSCPSILIDRHVRGTCLSPGVDPPSPPHANAADGVRKRGAIGCTRFKKR